MKVLLINSVCGSGSTGKIVAEISQELKKQGHEAKVAFGVGKALKIPKENTIKFNFKIGYYWHNFISRFTDHTGLYSILQTKYLIYKIQKYNPDIIHLNNLHGYYVNYKILFQFLKKYSKPIVWTLHDCWALTGHCTHFESINCTQWREHCKECKLLRRYPKCYTKGDVSYNYQMKKNAFTNIPSMVIVTPSKWLGNIVKSSFLQKYNLEVIENGIDTEIFQYRPSKFRDIYGLHEKIIVLGVANVWNDKKGLNDFLLLSTQLGSVYQIVLVGLTKKQKSELPPNIIGICRTENQNELAEIYSMADVFVNPTYEETYGMVNLEARACGIPVIVYNTGGCRETIKQGKGFVVEKGNINMLKNTIEYVTKNQELRVDNSRDMNIDKSKRYQEYINLYKKVVNAEMKGEG